MSADAVRKLGKELLAVADWADGGERHTRVWRMVRWRRQGVEMSVSADEGPGFCP